MLETKPGRLLTINSHHLKQQEDKWGRHYVNVYRHQTQARHDKKHPQPRDDKALEHYQEIVLAASIRAHFQIAFQVKASSLWLLIISYRAFTVLAEIH